MTGALPEPLCGGTAWASYTDIPDGPFVMHDPETWCMYLNLATDILWAATGRRWRGAGRAATATLRADNTTDEPATYHRSWGACPCSWGAADLVWSRRRRHHEPARIRLPHDDVTSVVAVLIDGQPFTAWERDGAWVTRTDGRGWPMCGQRTAITYAYGRNPPAAGAAMCVELAIELGRDGTASPDRECRLPRRASTVNRQGLSYTTENYFDYLADGLTGLQGPDMWIKSVNPKGRSQPASVWSPDLAYTRRIS